MKFTILPATLEDKGSIIEILSLWNMQHSLFIESEKIDLSLFFVAKIENNIVGVAGYTYLTPERGRTRLLAVRPECEGFGVGKALQDIRLLTMHKAGIKTVESRSDREKTILWYKKHYGYREIGVMKKIIPSGLIDVEYSTVLELDLDYFMQEKDKFEQEKSAYFDSNTPHPMAPFPPLIINVALTGAIPTKATNSHLPISVEEIIADAIKAHDAGASIVHLHARDASGKPTNNGKYFEKIIPAIRKERPELICCASTSGRGGLNFEERTEVLHLTGAAKPDMASLTLGSLNFINGPSVTSFETVQKLAFLMKEKGIKPELEVFDTGMINVAKYLERHKIISGTKYFNILLGSINTAPATINDLAHMYSSLPESSVWAGAGLAEFQLPVNMASIAAGGHVRVGLEDNVFYDAERTQHATNEMLIKRIVRMAKELGRPISKPAFTRKILQLG